MWVWQPCIGVLTMSDELTLRDGRVVELVSGIGQAATTHIEALLFNDRHRLVMDRSLKRLVRGKYLLKIGRRAPGLRGGNSPGVYRLASKAGTSWRRLGLMRAIAQSLNTLFLWPTWSCV